MVSDSQKLIQTLCYEIAASLEELVVVFDSKNRRVRWNALGFKCRESGLFDHRRKNCFGGLSLIRIHLRRPTCGSSDFACGQAADHTFRFAYDTFNQSHIRLTC